jgi:predicted kinase
LFENNEINSLEEAIGKTYEARSEHGKLILLCGPSGSGKSEWVNEYTSARSGKIVSLDQLRESIAGKRFKQSDNGKVMQAAKELLREGLRKKETIIWDATSLRADGRGALISMAHDYHATSEIVRFAVPPRELRRRNRKREHKIPEAVLQRQIERFEWPHLWEAHSVITVLES